MYQHAWYIEMNDSEGKGRIYLNELVHNLLGELRMSLHGEDVDWRKRFIGARLWRFVCKADHALILAHTCATK